MLVAEWFRIPLKSQSTSITSTFQCVLITDGSASYAVFIYECGGMEWSGATIGWQAGSSLYAEHPLSSANSSDVGCEYSFTYSAIVYRLDSDATLAPTTTTEPVTDSETVSNCYSSQFECDNGVCVRDSMSCDSNDDCGDNSDEDGCVNVELAIGLSVGLFAVMCSCGIPCCLIILKLCISCCSRRSKSTDPTHTSVIAAALHTTPDPGTTVVETPFTAPAQNSTPQPASYPMPQPVPHPLLPAQQPVTYPPQKEEHKDAQFSSEVAPPSYDAATAYPPYTIQPVIQAFPHNQATAPPPEDSDDKPKAPLYTSELPSAPPLHD